MNKLKKTLVIFILYFISCNLCGCNSNENKKSNNFNNTTFNYSTSNIQSQNLNSNQNNITNSPKEEKIQQLDNANTIETLIGEFETDIKSKSQNRLNNIQITCSNLNETIIEPGCEFSFCATIGKSTEEKGYKKADVIINKKIVQALGGGNCQVSSTLYNAVLNAIDNRHNLVVTERHAHGRKVDYVPEGKDAAISHGNKDLKFKNNTANQIKITAIQENQKVKIQIYEKKH